MAIANISQAQLIAWHETHFLVGFWQSEIGQPLLVEAKIPADFDVSLSLRFFELPIVIGLHFDQGTKNVLVLVSVLVSVQIVIDYVLAIGNG